MDAGVDAVVRYELETLAVALTDLLTPEARVVETMPRLANAISIDRRTNGVAVYPL